MIQNTAGLIIWVILFIFTLYFLFKLKLQLSKLPREVVFDFKEFDKIKEGQRILLPSVEFNNSLTLLMIVSPNCPPCHATLEQIIQDNKKYNVPLFVFAETNNQEQLKELIEKYNNIVKISPLSEVHKELLQVKVFPTIISLSNNGVVTNISHEYNPMKIYGANYGYY